VTRCNARSHDSYSTVPIHFAPRPPPLLLLPFRPLQDSVAAVLGILLDAQISCEEAIGLLAVYGGDGGEVERLDLPEHSRHEDAVVFGLFAGIAVEGEGAEFR
jgi:hypothetical protein